MDFEIIAQLLRNNRVGSYIIMYYIINYAQPFEKQDIVEMVKQLHSSLLQNIENPELQCCNLYILNILVSDAVLPYVDFNLQMFVSTENIQHETEMQNKITSALIMLELQLDKRSNTTEKLVKSIKDELQSLLEQAPEYIEHRNPHYLEAGTKTLLTLSYLQEKKILTQDQAKQLATPVTSLLLVHPLASHPLVYFMFASDDVEFRLRLFDRMIEALSKTGEVRIANNLMLSILSTVYAYPDELGQFVGLLIDNQFFKSSYIVQRHFIQVVLDLEKLCLIKLNQDIFTALFGLLISPNNDLQALAERLLLQQPQYAPLFVQNFLRCMETLNRDQITVEQRAYVYAKVLCKLPQTNKYQLLNILLEKAEALLVNPT